jgi:DNA-binding protein YbaB
MSHTPIDTPYGRKTPELLTRAMDALELQDELVAALNDLVGRIERDERIEMQHLTAARTALAKVKQP